MSQPPSTPSTANGSSGNGTTTTTSAAPPPTRNALYGHRSSPHEEVVAFLKNIQPKAYGSKQKQYLTAFANYYMTAAPKLADSDIDLILYGCMVNTTAANRSMLMSSSSSDKKGLMDLTGMSNMKSVFGVKRSAVLALQLVYILTSADNNPNALQFVSRLQLAPLNKLRAMRLERHLLGDVSKPEIACKLIAILEQSLTQLSVSSYVGSSEAVAKYNKWKSLNAATVANVDEEDAVERPPRTWAEVQLEEPEENTNVEVDAAGAAGNEATASINSATADATLTSEPIDPFGIVKQVRDGDELKGRRNLQRTMTIQQRVKRLNTIMSKLVKPNQPESKELEPDANDSFSLPTVNNNASININNEHFNAELFLARVHKNTSLSDLSVGMKRLQTLMDQRTDSMKTLVTENFASYVYAKQTIEHLYELLQTETLDSSTYSKTYRIKQHVDNVINSVADLHNPMLAKNSEIERLRSTSNIVERYKVLFDAVGRIRAAVQQQRYDAVVKEFNLVNAIRVQVTKTKQASLSELYEMHDQSVLTEVYAGILNNISEARQTIVNNFSWTTASITQLHTTLDTLHQLQSPTHPTQLLAAKAEVDLVHAFNNAMNTSDGFDTVHVDVIAQRLIDIVQQVLPCLVELIDQSRVGGTSDDTNRVIALIDSVMAAFADHIQSLFVPASSSATANGTSQRLSSISTQKLLSTITAIINCNISTQSNQLLDSVMYESGSQYIGRIVEEYNVKLAEIVQAEDWQPVNTMRIDLALADTQLTALPAAVRQQLHAALTRILIAIPMHTSWSIKQLTDQYVSCITQLGSRLNDLMLQYDSTQNDSADLSTAGADNDSRLLLLLNNVMYLNDTILPELIDRLKQATNSVLSSPRHKANRSKPNVQSLQQPIEQADHTISDLFDSYETQIINTYVKNKQQHAINYMYQNYITAVADGSSSSQSILLHPAITHLLLHVVSAHRELYVYSPSELDTSLTAVCDACIEALLDLLSSTQNQVTPQQAYIDTAFLLSILTQHHLSNDQYQALKRYSQRAEKQVLQTLSENEGRAYRSEVNTLMTELTEATATVFLPLRASGQNGIANDE